MKRAGILMPIASLPSNYGVGDFGSQTYQFIDYLKEAKVKIWQILPLNPLGYGNSPYQNLSSYALDLCYLSLEKLYEEKLIKKPKNFNKNAKWIDYDAVRAFKRPYIVEAFNNFKPTAKYKTFIAQKWVKDYASFVVLKKENDLKCWIDWKEEHKKGLVSQTLDLSVYQKDIDLEMFTQYLLFNQWNELRKYAHKSKIEILGDIPFYVGIDSVDVYFSQENYLLDKDGRPTFIAGVPPDYFSATGQRWGNPIYDWDYMEKDQFGFWLKRIEFASKLFDYIRIDHFRAFDTFWKIPSSCPTAIEGEWIEAPGYKLFDTLFAAQPNLKIVAEDLGLLRKEVYELRDHYHFPGMNVFQFNFNAYEPEKFPNEENMIVYSGTHDNESLKSWYSAKDAQFKRKTKSYIKKMGIDYPSINQTLIAFILQNKANMAIINMIDLLELDDKARLNTPGTVGYPNWCWRLKDYQRLEKYLPFLKEQIKRTKR